MSGTSLVKLEPEVLESSDCTEREDLITQSSQSQNYLSGGCESEIKIKSEIKGSTEFESTRLTCGETSTLCYNKSVQPQMIFKADARDNMQEFAFGSSTALLLSSTTAGIYLVTYISVFLF